MSTRSDHPKWWQVYLTFPLLIVLLIVESRLKISERGHQVVQMGIVIFICGLVHLWLKANAKALANMEQGQFPGRVTVIQIPPYQLADTSNSSPSRFQLTNPEIKGTLSNTFEMETIDAEFFNVDEATQELNKE